MQIETVRIHVPTQSKIVTLGDYIQEFHIAIAFFTKCITAKHCTYGMPYESHKPITLNSLLASVFLGNGALVGSMYSIDKYNMNTAQKVKTVL